MLLAAIDENHRGTYDFVYLPIDFKVSLLWAFNNVSYLESIGTYSDSCVFVQNKCNVGYAFINMLSPSHIIPFYEVFQMICLLNMVSLL